MEAKHTPGPWLLDDENGVIANNQVVARVKPVSHPILRKVDVEQWNANANLIATAPEMLQMLRHCHQWLQGSKPGRAQAIGELIRKATGEHDTGRESNG